MIEEIDFPAIYKEIDKQVSREKIYKSIGYYLLWIIGILYICFLIAVTLGYIKIPDRCGYDNRSGDVECWDPRS
jgi:hypothetical protein